MRGRGILLVLAVAMLVACLGAMLCGVGVPHVSIRGNGNVVIMGGAR